MKGWVTHGRPFEMLLDCAALMYGGMPKQFPRLKIAFLECGVGWVPYWMDRMDEEWGWHVPACRLDDSGTQRHLGKLQAKDPWRQRETLVRMGRLNQKSIWRKQVK
jgi:predicted TIM-barrel fold metal-dependent hydrolase